MLLLGEVRTCLLHNSGPLPRAAVADLLDLKVGRRVLVTDRPVNRSISPDLMVGVDCRLGTEPLTRARGIGTVASHAIVTGGLVLQSSARARLERAATNSRRAWSHYASERGVIEVISKADVEQLARGHRTAAASGSMLDLGSISEHLLGVVQMRPQLDRRTTIRLRATKMRWSAVACSRTEPLVMLHVDGGALRTAELYMPADQLPLAERFCEDLALHDWLITALGSVIEQADRDTAVGADPINTLTAAVERLVHLWMPGAHVHPVLWPLWEALERRPGFSLQWNAQVAQVRDQIALRTLHALERARQRETSW